MPSAEALGCWRSGESRMFRAAIRPDDPRIAWLCEFPAVTRGCLRSDAD
jgi:hypothetical protein